MVGTEETRLIVLRGNSASGKSSVAAGLRDRFGRGLALVGRDNLRRIVLRGANIVLIDTVARYYQTQDLTPHAAGLHVRSARLCPRRARFPAAWAFYNGRSSALRQRIRGVEEAAGFPIIDRTNRPLAPTEQGQAFLHEAAGILRIADASREPG
jgi:hypothetical protein